MFFKSFNVGGTLGIIFYFSLSPVDSSYLPRHKVPLSLTLEYIFKSLKILLFKIFLLILREYSAMHFAHVHPQPVPLILPRLTVSPPPSQFHVCIYVFFFLALTHQFQFLIFISYSVWSYPLEHGLFTESHTLKEN